MADSLPIFVGSTSVDLAAHREAVLYALQRLETIARGMEHFGSLPGTPKDECLRCVRDCRVYIGIFAMRYGSIDPETGKSITQVEYEEAQRFHLQSLMYLIDEERQPVLPKHIDFGESAEKLTALKSLVKQHHVVSLFTTPEDLAMRVTQDVARLIQESSIAVEESALARIVGNLPRIDWLDEGRFAFLKTEIGSLADPIGSDVVLREALQFILSGDNLSAAFLVTQSTRLNVREAIDLLMEISKSVGRIIVKGYRVMEQQGKVPPEFVLEFEQYVSEHSRLPVFQRSQHRQGGARQASASDMVEPPQL